MISRRSQYHKFSRSKKIVKPKFSLVLTTTIAIIALNLTNSVSSVLAFNPEHLRRLIQSGECQRCDLSSADLSGQNLEGNNFSGSNLRGANFSGADLTGANLTGAKLQRATLWRSLLRDVDLRNADLRDASLVVNDLQGMNL